MSANSANIEPNKIGKVKPYARAKCVKISPAKKCANPTTRASVSGQPKAQISSFEIIQSNEKRAEWLFAAAATESTATAPATTDADLQAIQTVTSEPGPFDDGLCANFDVCDQNFKTEKEKSVDFYWAELNNISNELNLNNNSRSNIEKEEDIFSKEMNDQELNEFNQILDDLIANHLLEEPLSNLENNNSSDHSINEPVFDTQNEFSNNIELEFIDNTIFLQNNDPMMMT